MRKNMKLFHTLFSMRESARSQGHRMPGLLSGEKKKREKNGDAKNGGRDANIFASRQSQRGESVQKVSLRQRQVTYMYTHKDGIQGGGELPGRDLRLGHHLPE